MKYPINLEPYAPPTRAALLAHIAEARAKGDRELAALGENALRRHDALAARRDTEAVSGVRLNPTQIGVAPPAVRSAPTPLAVVPPHPTTYSFVRRVG